MDVRTVDPSPRRVLLIAYHFPPSAAVGGMRMANFAKWLSLFGWESHVLTIPQKYIEHLDVERLEALQSVRIQRVGLLPTVVRMYSVLKQRFSGNCLPARMIQPSAAPVVNAARPESLARKIKRYILSILVFPDYEAGWIIPAALAAIRQIRRQRIDSMMTSCPPYSAHLIGLIVKTMTGTKWVADFRDPWMTTGWKRTYPTCALSMRFEMWLEKKVVENADIVMFNVDRLKTAYQKRYVHVPTDKFVYIPNGMPSCISANAVPLRKYETFTLSYTGSFYVGRSPEPVFQAISHLIREGVISSDAVRVKLVGHCRAVDGAPTTALIDKYGLESVVELIDPLPYTQALNILRRSHLALLLAPNLPFQIPAKLYDYLGTGVRILAIAEEGGTADLVRETDSGCAFPSHDVEGIKNFLLNEMQFQNSMNRNRAAAMARFDMRRVTEQLAIHLDRIPNTRTADAGRF
jgi:glycosyltransferase involved in cell wall biosynthesis